MADSVPTGFVAVCPKCWQSDKLVLRSYRKYFCGRCGLEFDSNYAFPDLKASHWIVTPGSISGVSVIGTSYSGSVVGSTD